MAYTPENNPYIPGDPYSYDLKWVVSNIKDLIANYTGQMDELKAFIMDYINSLDLSPIVAAELQEMYDNGDFDALIASFITDNKVLLVDTDQSAIFTEAEKAQGRKNLAAGNTNPNLLDNGWFTVNQRNFTSASSVGYCVDRWRISYNDATVTLNSDNTLSILKTASGCGGISQYLENIDYNATYTASVMDINGNIYVKTGKFNTGTSGETWFDIGSLHIAICLWTTGGKPTFALYTSGTYTGLATIKANKLERGDHSTIIDDAPPNYAEELAKCQRYFMRISSPLGGYVPLSAVGYANSTSTVRFAIALPVTMRTSPSLAYTLTMQAIGNGTSANITALSFLRLYENSVSLEATVSGTLTLNAIYTFAAQNGYIDLSADL